MTWPRETAASEPRVLKFFIPDPGHVHEWGEPQRKSWIADDYGEIIGQATLDPPLQMCNGCNSFRSAE